MSDTHDHLIIGILGRDPELKQREGQNGPYDEVILSVAVERRFGDGTDWLYCKLTGKKAKVINDYFKKGNSIYLFGHMESYKKDNITHWLFRASDFEFPKITAKDVEDFNSRKAKSNEHAPENEPENEQSEHDTFEDIDEDVPF